MIRQHRGGLKKILLYNSFVLYLKMDIYKEGTINEGIHKPRQRLVSKYSRECTTIV